MPRFLPEGEFAGYIGSCIAITDHLEKRLKLSGIAEGALLTAREVQVLTRVAEGKSTEEAAAVLGVSYKTADSHRTRIFASDENNG